MFRPTRLGLAALVGGALMAGCDTPHTTVILDNRYSPSDTNAFVILRAFWQAVPFTDPVLPGESSTEQPTVSASPNTAYVLVAPGWDPDAGTAPSSFLLLRSRGDFGLDYDSTLRIPVDDAHFVGNCAAGERLTQDEADFIAAQVFPAQLSSFHYDARTCTTTATP
jgi:hypothetical protein